jgi:predicted TPR repeat methyltransferase
LNCNDLQITYPSDACELDQNEEWVKVQTEDGMKKIRLHDYGRFFEIPGLYEEVVYNRLKCESPQVVCDTLQQAMTKVGVEEEDLAVLDFGAGNGMVGEQMKDQFECKSLVGIDIIPQAQEATERDRPGLYDDYYVMDMSTLNGRNEKNLEKWGFNALVTVAALGYGDIPAQAFLNAFNLLDEGGWVAFNIKDRFLSDEDDTGYRETLDRLMGDSLSVLESKRYRHRLSLAGDPLHYYAIAGRKIKDAPVDTMAVT